MGKITLDRTVAMDLAVEASHGVEDLLADGYEALAKDSVRAIESVLEQSDEDHVTLERRHGWGILNAVDLSVEDRNVLRDQLIEE